MSPIDLAPYLASLLVLIGLIVSATEALGRMTGVPKERLCVVLGPLLSVAAHASGVLTLPGGAHGVWSWILAGLLGLLVAATSGAVNDYVVNPAVEGAQAVVATITEPVPKRTKARRK